MEHIKIIENEVKSILNESMDFVDLHNKFNELLSELYDNLNDLNSKKAKLLNILFTHSKKKILFKYKDVDYNSPDEENPKLVDVGVNTSGLGISNHYENNLRNITDYYIKDKFAKLCKDVNFIKKLVNSVKKDKRKIIPKLLVNEKEEYNKNIHIGDLKISIKSRLNYSHQNKKDSYYDDDIIIIDKDIKPFEKISKKSYLNEVTDRNIDVDFEDLIKFSWLMKSKAKIISHLNEAIKLYKATNEATKKKLKEVDNELKPYEALEKI